MGTEGLRRLMFSTVMLVWNLHSELPRMISRAQCPRMSPTSWIEINTGLEADGGAIPIPLQLGIFECVARQPLQSLLPDATAPATSAPPTNAVEGFALIP